MADGVAVLVGSGVLVRVGVPVGVLVVVGVFVGSWIVGDGVRVPVGVTVAGLTAVGVSVCVGVGGCVAVAVGVGVAGVVAVGVGVCVGVGGCVAVAVGVAVAGLVAVAVGVDSAKGTWDSYTPMSTVPSKMRGFPARSVPNPAMDVLFPRLMTGESGRMEMGCLDAAYDDLTLAIDQLHQLGNRHYEVKARCDLGLVHHLTSNHDLARAALNLALTLLGEYGDLRFEALGNTCMGYVLEATGQLVEAANCFQQGCDLHDRMGQHYYALNAQAGLARIAALQGEDDVALDHVAAIWETIGGKEMDATIETARTLRTCFMIFDANGDPRADAVLDMAWDQLQRRASTIDESAHLEQFWQIDEHRFFHDLM